jgi:hypothetical protein
MDEFKNDLIELFKKHNILALQGSVELHFSPLYHDDNMVTRDILFKFSQLLTDREEINEHREKYGTTYRRDYFNIYEE